MIRAALVPWPAVALIDLLNRVIDGADDLACRGYFDPDPDEEIPPDLAAELAVLIAGCKRCRIGPSALGEHWLNRKQQEHERSLPVWTCDCGAVYKPLAEWGGRQDFYHALDDCQHGPLCAGASRPPGTEDCPHSSCADILFGGGYLLGDHAGFIQVTSKGKVRHSDPCPGCGASFAVTIARQNDPQQPLF